MWSADIAVQLRRHGFDVVAVSERPELRGQPDPKIFSVAQAEERAVVTDNVIDFRPLAASAGMSNQSHSGLILTTNRRFPHHDPRTIGRLVKSLAELVSSQEDLTNREYWLL